MPDRGRHKAALAMCLTLAVLLFAVSGCASVHCSTEGSGGGPGGCGFEQHFSTY